MTDYFKLKKEIKTKCLYCEHTHSDPEYGYICCFNLKDYFYAKAYKCPINVPNMNSMLIS